MSKGKEWFYVAIILMLCIGLVVVKHDNQSTKVAYKDKPQTSDDWCKLPLLVGTKGVVLKGYLGGLSGVVAGKINNGVDCAYIIKFQNKDIWNGDGIHRQPVNQDNFVEAKL